LVRYLEKHQGSATYLVAVNGSQSAAPFILESGKAVIAMGGFGGSDPAPTLSEFKHLVATGKVHYVYVSGGIGAGAGGGSGFGTAGGGGTPPGGIRTTASTKNTKSTGSRAGGGGLPSGGGTKGSAGTHGGGQTTSTASAVDAWVEKYGTKVSSSAYGGTSSGGTLYYISSSAATE
jgi:4-amino-4-deoxy-L-arabinose transferase-like glycosyltransferase